jgi:hypothetical protein
METLLDAPPITKEPEDAPPATNGSAISGIAGKIKAVSKPSFGASLSSKIKEASKASKAAQAAKKHKSAPVGKREQATYPIMRPPKSKFVRVHPDEAYRQYNVPVLEDPDTNDLYFMDESLQVPEFILATVRRVNLYAAQTHDHSIFLWAVKQSDTPWYKAAPRAVSTAVNKWVAVRARKAANTYDLTTPIDTIPEPDWSSLPSFDEMLDTAFDDHAITYLEHPLLKKLQGINDDDDGLI